MVFTAAVPPAYLQGLEIFAAEEALDSKLLSYDERLGGIILAYDDLDFEDDGMGFAQDEQPDVLFRFKAKVLMYSPKKGERMKAVVSDITPGHVTLLLAGVFPVVVRSPEYPLHSVFNNHNGKSLINSKTKEPLIQDGGEYLIKCIRITHQSGTLQVEASFRTGEQ